MTFNFDFIFSYVRCWVLEDEGEDPAFITEQQNAVYCAFSPKGHRISVEYVYRYCKFT